MRAVHSQRGDTLLEVVIAIAILAVTLAVAFTVANFSYRAGLSGRERTQAAHILQDQAEKLRRYRDQLVYSQQNSPLPDDEVFELSKFPGASLVTPPSAPITNPITGGTVFGIDIAGNIVPFAGPALADNVASYPELCFGLPSCQVSIYIHLSQNGANPQLSKLDALIYVTWASLIGGGQNQAQLSYTLADTRAVKPCDNSVAGDCS